MTWTPPSAAVQKANSKLAHDTLIAGWPNAPGGALAGLSEVATAGILAQFKREAAFDPDAVGDHGNAVGEGQWWPVRRTIIRDGLRDRTGNLVVPGCGIDIGLLPGVVDQTHAALWELYHSEHPALLAILAAKTPYAAGMAACVSWMRPHPPDNRVQRGNDAATIFAFYSK